jgi:hypothetical protein
MRTPFTAMLLAMGICLAGAAGTNAEPVNGAAVVNAVADASAVTQVRWHSRRVCHWVHRWHSRGHRVCYHR